MSECVGLPTCRLMFLVALVLSPGLVDEDHLEVVGEGGQHGPVSFEVDVSDGDGAVT